MPYTVYWTTPSGAMSEKHTDCVRAAERALTFSDLGASNVYVENGIGNRYLAPSELSDLLRDARTADGERT